MSWPVIVAAGGARARGRSYGAAARDRVHGSIALYERIFAHYTGLGWPEVRARAGVFAEAIDAYDVEILPELEGIGEGAGVDAEDILALNVRSEIMFGLDARTAWMAAKECTAVCLRPERTADARTIHAENWDWKPGAARTCVLLASAPHGRPGFVTLVEAGLLAKCGMNEAGIAVTANAMVSSRDRGGPGVPFHAILRRILTSATFDEAREAVSEPERAGSGNYLISGPGGRSVNLEAGPGTDDALHAIEAPALVHANHFLWEARPFKDLGRIDGQDSLRRQERAETTAAAPQRTIESVGESLRDHEGWPDSVCSHADPASVPEADYVTVASIVMTPETGTMLVTEGTPCDHPFEAMDTAALLASARGHSAT